MKNHYLLVYIFIFLSALSASASSTESISWGNIGFLNINKIEESASKFIYKSIPELDGIRVKMLHVRARYNSPSDFYLVGTFIHKRSFKNVKNHAGLEDWKRYGIKYYMETIDIEFNEEGNPVNVQLNEVALSVAKDKAIAEFEHHFNIK
ncbi:hypothetical protein [Thalassotalea sp. PLHSN55]|uniref:hypothetical protein n=1 Tax=Thalassotalea sp. PLHSN55 TaxID=3435888 RepID=UPI003F8311EF